MNINGSTDIYGLFGYPIKHTSSPAMHNIGFQKLGINAVYLPFEVKPEDLSQALAALPALGIKGVNLTIPHKEACLEFLDDLSPEARLIGAVNTVVAEGGKLTGYNTDALGFITSLREDLEFDPAGHSVFMLGAGGASQAVTMQLACSGVKNIFITDLDLQKSKKIANHILECGREVDSKSPEFEKKMSKCSIEAVELKSAEFKEKISKCQLVVNATPVGMKPDDPLPIDEDLLRPDLFVYDLVYNLKTTKLVTAAKKKGGKAVTGTGMLLYQGVRAFELWTGTTAPVEDMRQALLESIKI